MDWTRRNSQGEGVQSGLLPEPPLGWVPRKCTFADFRDVLQAGSELLWDGKLWDTMGHYGKLGLHPKQKQSWRSAAALVSAKHTESMETGHQMRGSGNPMGFPLVLLGESQVLQDSPVHQHWHDRSQAEHGSRGELIIIVPFVSFVIVHCAFGRLCRFHACFGISRRSFAGHTWTLLPRRKQKFGLQDP